ncbi:MAG: IclR family transcriptional regulator [Candidatus Saccharicenans sp.]|jgi:DNA-binding IclR family transcriptional regulator|nr:IclR family transcriptional regulator [Candidatus Saccharicenans sp.]MDH7575214.1 IclR family transcriptional regulator [Candidatus Saccharicenans sp.]
MSRKKEGLDYFSTPFAKGLSVLGLFNPDHKNFSLKEIADALDTNPSSAYRFVNTLVKLGYLTKDPRTKLLSLGQRSYLLGLNLVNSYSLLDVVKPFIDEVNEKLNVSVDSCVLEGDHLLQLYFRPAKDAPYYQGLIINPAINCTGLGKAILAFLPQEEQKQLLDRIKLYRRTENSITDKAELIADLERTRKRGYATNNEEYIKGLITIAVPFINLKTEHPVGAVSFDFLIHQGPLREIEKKYASALLKLGQDISAVIK